MSGTGFVFTPAGLQPQTPAELRAQLLALATIQSPGLTANLPGSLVEDIVGTDVGALTICDQAAVETVASLVPNTASPWLLLQLSQIYLGQGSTAAPQTNTAVFCVFTGTVGFIVPPGFLVSDGGHQYTVQDGGIVGSGGSSDPVFCLATVTGSWAVPANSVTTVATSLPAGVALTVTNPLAGTAGGDAETEAEFRSRVLRSGIVASMGTPDYIKTRLGEVVGVTQRLVSVRQGTDTWEVIVGGTGDPYSIAYAIYRGIPDISTLAGSVISVVGITNANPGVVTTDLNHGYATGQVVTITGVVGMSGINGTPLTITVLTEKTFSIGINTTSSGTWTSGGVLSPNFRNVSVSINSYPDTYVVPFVIPPLQNVTITLTWNTDSPNYVNPMGVAQLAQPALAAYINSIPVGEAINVFVMNQVFVTAISGIVDPVLVTRIVFTVSINGIVTAPGSGTGEIAGDPESYFNTTATSISVVQG